MKSLSKKLAVGAITAALLAASCTAAIAAGPSGFSFSGRQAAPAGGGANVQLTQLVSGTQTPSASSDAQSQPAQKGQQPPQNGQQPPQDGQQPPQNGQQPPQDGRMGDKGGKGGMLEALAADVGVTVTDGEKPDAVAAAIKTAVEALDSDALATLAGKYDIETDGKTDAELVAAVEALLTPPARGEKPAAANQQA